MTTEFEKRYAVFGKIYDDAQKIENTAERYGVLTMLSKDIDDVVRVRAARIDEAAGELSSLNKGTESIAAARVMTVAVWAGILIGVAVGVSAAAPMALVLAACAYYGTLTACVGGAAVVCDLHSPIYDRMRKPEKAALEAELEQLQEENHKLESLKKLADTRINDTAKRHENLSKEVAGSEIGQVFAANAKNAEQGYFAAPPEALKKFATKVRKL